MSSKRKREKKKTVTKFSFEKEIATLWERFHKALDTCPGCESTKVTHCKCPSSNRECKDCGLHWMWCRSCCMPTCARDLNDNHIECKKCGEA